MDNDGRQWVYYLGVYFGTKYIMILLFVKNQHKIFSVRTLHFKSMSNTRLIYVTKLLMYGYSTTIQKDLSGTIPSSIIDLFFAYYYINPNSHQWKIKDQKLLHFIKNAENRKEFKSEPFTIQGLTWHLGLYPNGSEEQNKGTCELFLILHTSDLERDTTASIKRTFKFVERDIIKEEKILDYTKYYHDYTRAGRKRVGSDFPFTLCKTEDIAKYKELTFTVDINVLFLGDKRNLIVNYLPLTMNEGTLATLFSPYGLLERVKIVIDLSTRKSRGYGFIKFENEISAERAMNKYNGYEYKGKKIEGILRESAM